MSCTYLPTRFNKRWPTPITSDEPLVLGWEVNSSVLGSDANSSRSRMASRPPRRQIYDWVGRWLTGWNSNWLRTQPDGGPSNSWLGLKPAINFGPKPSALSWRQCSIYTHKQTHRHWGTQLAVINYSTYERFLNFSWIYISFSTSNNHQKLKWIFPNKKSTKILLPHHAQCVEINALFSKFNV